MAIANKQQKMERRRKRVRTRTRGTADMPRLSVFASNKHYYAQAIDDGKGRTVAASSDVAIAQASGMPKREKAQAVGRDIARRLSEEKKIKKVVFDRGGKRYAGNLKVLADAAREAGLTF